MYLNMYQSVILLFLVDIGCPPPERTIYEQYIFLECENPRPLPCYYISLIAIFLYYKGNIFEMLNMGLTKMLASEYTVIGI